VFGGGVGGLVGWWEGRVRLGATTAGREEDTGHVGGFR